MSASIEVLDMRRFDSGGSLRAFVTVRIGGVAVHGCCIVQQPGQDAWVAMPQREWTGDNGKKNYSPVVELSNELRKRVSETVLARVRL